MKRHKMVRCLTVTLGLLISVSAHANGRLVASCTQEPAGCHVQTGQSESSTICVQGVDLKIYSGAGSSFDATIRVLNAISGVEEFNEDVSNLMLTSEVVLEHYGSAELTSAAVLSNPNNQNLQNRNIAHKITINVTPNAPNLMYGYYHANVDCDYSQVTPDNCYSSQSSIGDISSSQYGYVTTGRFECQVVDKIALQIQY